MSFRKHNDEGFTGLEAAIVLIAFVVVAAVFSYVVLGAGFFTTQKAQETVYKGVEQSTANIQMIGSVYGQSTDNTSITSLQYGIGLAPGAPAMDLTKMTIVFSTPTSPTPILYVHNSTAAAIAGTPNFTSMIGTTTQPALDPNEQVIITFTVLPVPANTKMNIELRPSVGAALPFTKTAPATIANTNVLY
jgi:flagellin FlaB